MREEAMSFLFENQVFAIDVGDDGIVRALPLFVKEFNQGRKSWPMEKIKRVEISVTLQKSLPIPFLAPLLKRVCEVLAGYTKLAKVRITPTCPTMSLECSARPGHGWLARELLLHEGSRECHLDD